MPTYNNTPNYGKGAPALLFIKEDGVWREAESTDFSGGGGVDRELIVSTYLCKTAFTGASVGDTITSTQIIDVSATPTTVSVIWRNQTTGIDITAPSSADLTLLASNAITDAQLRATPVPVSISDVATETTLAAQSTLMGATTETAPVSDTAISGLNGRLQRIAQNITTMISNITEMITATNRSGTREYNMAGITRQAVGAASARVALPTLGASRELYVMASTRCFFRSGDSSITAAAGASHPLAADERFHLRVPAGHTHIAYIRDSSDGNITIVPVA